MPNWCSVSATMRCVSEDAAQTLYLRLKAEQDKAKEKRRAMFWGSDLCYIFGADLLPVCGNEVTLYGEVRWSIPDDEAVAIVEWLLRQSGVVEIQIEYEESGCLLYGKYRWAVTSNAILNEYLPSEYWPEWSNDEEYVDCLENAFEKHNEVIVIKSF